MRDYALETTFDIKFTTRKFSTGAPFTLAGTPAVAAYPNNSTTEITAGITLTVDFDLRTGLNNVRVVATAANGYAAGSNYSLVITAGTVDTVSVVGEVIGEFSLEAQSPLRPTTANRTLDVTAANKVNGVVLVDTVTTLTNLPAITANWLTAAGIAASALNGKGDWNIGKTGYALSAAGVQAIWDALTTALTTAGSIGKLLVDNINATISSRSSHSAADVWTSAARTLTAATNITSTGGTTVPQTGDSFARLGAAGAGLTDLGGFSTTAKAQIQTEAEEALQSHHVVLVKTTIATLASQTSFTLTAGSADNDAYNGCEIVVEDSVMAAQKAVGVVSDYTGATKTVTLLNDPAVFTMAAGDLVTIRPSRALKPAVDNRNVLVNASGHVERVTLNDTTTTNTDMRGTDNAALASVCTEARLAELAAANLPADVDQIKADLPSRITKNAELAAFPFKMVDATDHVTAETGLTVTATRSIDGAAFAACANAVSEVASGWYKITLATTDLNGNTIVLRFTATGADTAEFVIVTQPT